MILGCLLGRTSWTPHCDDLSSGPCMSLGPGGARISSRTLFFSSFLLLFFFFRGSTSPLIDNRVSVFQCKRSFPEAYAPPSKVDIKGQSGAVPHRDKATSNTPTEITEFGRRHLTCARNMARNALRMPLDTAHVFPGVVLYAIRVSRGRFRGNACCKCDGNTWDRRL